MKNIIIGLITGVLMLVTPSAFADNENGGTYAGGGIGIYTGGVTLTIPASSVSVDLGSSSLDVGLNLFGGYKMNMGKGSIAGEVAFNSGTGKNINLTSGATTSNIKMTNNWSVSVLPGYNLTQDTTSYLRLGYTQGKGEMTATGAPASSHTFNGYVVGFGVDQAVSPNLAARLEYQVLNFSSWTDTTGTTSKPRSTGLNLSVRYAF